MTVIECGVKERGEDTASIKSGGDLDVNLNAIHNNAEDGEDNEELLAVAMVNLEMGEATAGALEEKQEMTKEDSSGSHNEQQGRDIAEGSGLACAVATPGEQGGNNAVSASVMDTAC